MFYVGRLGVPLIWVSIFSTNYLLGSWRKMRVFVACIFWSTKTVANSGCNFNFKFSVSKHTYIFFMYTKLKVLLKTVLSRSEKLRLKMKMLVMLLILRSPVIFISICKCIFDYNNCKSVIVWHIFVFFFSDGTSIVIWHWCKKYFLKY